MIRKTYLKPGSSVVILSRTTIRSIGGHVPIRVAHTLATCFELSILCYATRHDFFVDSN